MLFLIGLLKLFCEGTSTENTESQEVPTVAQWKQGRLGYGFNPWPHSVD